MQIVVINDVEYIPRSTIVSDATMKLLAQAYSIAWCGGHYDPDCEHESRNGHLRKVSDLLSAANQELRFKK